MANYIFGVDVGGTTVKIGLFDSHGQLLDDWEIPTRLEENGQYILADIAKALLAKCQEKNIAQESVLGIGMGIPGPSKDEQIVLKCVNLGWGEINVSRQLSELTGFRVWIGNDANVAALGEMWQGGGRGYPDMVMITLGTGVGAGIILQGRILSGIHGAAGEIGHLAMKDDEGEFCGCGKTGCLEQYASANGLVRVTRKYLQGHPQTETILRSNAALTAKNIFDAAKSGDRAALQMIDEAADLLGKALAYIACVVDVEAFVIGGGMAKAGDILLQAIRKHYMQYAFPACREAEFKFAELGNRAGIYGGARLVLNKK